VGGLADALTDRGYDMLLSRVDADSLDSAAALVEAGKAIGLVIVGQWRHHDQLNALAARRMPLVVWGGQLPQQLYCSVGGDNVQGGLLATRHLLQAGRRRVLFAGDPALPEVYLRREGWRQALREAGLQPDPALELVVPFETIAARERLDTRCASGLDFDAVVACSDLMAVQAVQALRAAGRAVPQDVAVVGYDDMAIATYTEPALTTVHQPVLLAGEELVEALLALLRGETVSPRTLPVHLVVRASAPA
jgi:DNA-binding LacI/PurR family transcriptional regulator